MLIPSFAAAYRKGGSYKEDGLTKSPFDEDDGVGMALLNFQHGSRDVIALPPYHKLMDRDRLTLNH